MSGYAIWSPFTTYAVDDIVFFDGIIYISIQTNNTNHQPNSSPTWWASNGGGSTITSISAGAGIAVSGSTAVLITNTGVRTLTAGAGMTVGGTTTDRTVVNDGVLQLTAGTNVSITGTKANYTISSAVDGVQTLTAGANVSITGTTANPIISATSSPLPTPQTPRDTAGALSYTLTALQLGNSVIFSSVAYPAPSAPLIINLPSYASMLAQYGANATVPFFLGDLNYTLTDLYLSSTEDKTKIFISNSLQGNSVANLQNFNPTQLALLPSGQYSVPNLQTFQCLAYVNSARGSVNYNLNWFGTYS